MNLQEVRKTRDRMLNFYIFDMVIDSVPEFKNQAVYAKTLKDAKFLAKLSGWKYNDILVRRDG